MSHVCHIYEWVMSRTHTYVLFWLSVIQWVMSHVWMIHVTHVDELCHTCEWFMSHIWMSHVLRMHESCHAHTHMSDSDLFAICKSVSHVTHMNESCHTCEWVTSHVWISHVARTDESCHAYKWVMSRIWMRHVTHMSDPPALAKCKSISHCTCLRHVQWHV